MSLDPDAVVATLKKQGFTEVAQVQTFEAVRQTSGGDSQLVTIRVYSEPDERRYAAEAEADSKRTVRSNARPSVADCLLNVHWNELE